LIETRATVRSWLQERTASSGGARHSAPHPVKESDAELVQHFLIDVQNSGFALEISNQGSAESPAWVGYWTYRGSTFEGFRQPQDSADPDTARLLACAALLRNDWCRARL
jgi:hypothetical protein